MFTVRPGTLADTHALAAHRRAMFSDMGHQDAAALDAMTAAFLLWVRQKMTLEEYVAWLAVSPEGSIVSGLGLWLMDWPPHMVAAGRRRGNILNVYTEPGHRRQGMARALMQIALDWCAANQLDIVILHSSDDGREIGRAHV